jgi:hypothetical protein
VFRAAFAVPLLVLLKEVRVVEHISYRNLMFKLISMGPRRGMQLLVIGRKNGTPPGKPKKAQRASTRGNAAPEALEEEGGHG